MSWQRIALGCAAGILAAQSAGVIVAAVIPFLLAWLAARLIRPLGVRLASLAHIREIPFCAVYGIVVLFGTGYVLAVLSGRLLAELWQLIGRLPEAAEIGAELLTGLVDLLPFSWSEYRMGQFYGIVSHGLDEAAAWLGNRGAEFLGRAVQGIGGGVVSLVMGSVAFVYLTADPDGAVGSLKKILPEKWRCRIGQWCRDASGVMFSYIRAWLILALVTMAELAMGLSMIGAENPLASAFIITLIDALPVFGCSVVMIPWSVWEFLTGNTAMGIGLLILLGVVYAVRQFLEPRLIGRVTGVHPAVVLLAVYVGWKTAGVVGMIGAPVILAGLTGEDRKIPLRHGVRHRGMM